MLYFIFVTLSSFIVIYAVIDWFRRQQTITNLYNKCIFITGCDSGFGQLLARKLDGMGCQVIAGCLTENGAKELDEMTSSRCKTITMDVTKSESIQRAFECVTKLVDENEGLWGLVNNAGVTSTGLLRWLRKRDYELCINVNLYGTIDVTTTFLPLVRQGRGRVVNMSSMGGLFAIPGCPAYTISKYGVEAFSDELRREETDICVSIIEPGQHNTAISDPDTLVGLLKTAWENAPPDVKKQDVKLIDNLCATLRENLQANKSNDPNRVVNAYVHALTSAYPRKRYVVGMDAMCFRILSLLPTSLADYLFKKMMNYVYEK